ncbi:site-specific integrase [Rhodococcus sp. 5G237]
MRRQLPPQIKKIELDRTERGKPVVRYQLTVDIGVDPDTGKRKQLRRRFPTESVARDELARIQATVKSGQYIHDRGVTVTEVIDHYLTSKHALKPSTAAGYKVSLAPIRQVLGDLPIQKLTRRHLDELIATLRAGGLPTDAGKPRKPWSARSVNQMLTVFTAALDGLVKEGHLVRNVAALIDKLPDEREETETWSETEVEQFLLEIRDDPYAHAWYLALSGLRRGEICGLRWDDIDLDAKTLTIERARVSFGVTTVEGSTKSKRSRRTLPLPDDLARQLRAARARQASDRMLLGEAWKDSGYVIVDQAGNPLSPGALSARWVHAVQRAKVRPIRLHDARHTCATLMHLRGVPIAVIAAWLGHASAAFTLSRYAHSQDPAMVAAAQLSPVSRAVQD